MSTLKTNNIQIGQSGTASQNFVLAVPAAPDGTIKLSRGVVGATTQDVLTVGADGKVTFPLGGGGLSNVSTISSNTTAAVNTLYVLTASLTLTLPASPSINALVGVSNFSNTTTAVVARNGSNIMGVAEDLILDASQLSISLIYTGTDKGWVVI